MKQPIYAAIDFGSNSINLAVYDLAGGKMVLLHKQKAMPGVIRYIQDGLLSNEGIREAAAVIADMQKTALAMNAGIFCFATASLRGVKNKSAVTGAIRSATGLTVDLISWEKEAYYDYLAVTHLMGGDNALAADIGGGSIELVHICGGRLCQSASIPTGSLKLSQDYVPGVRPEGADIEQIDVAMGRYLDGIEWIGQTGCSTLYTIGGTARAVAKLHRTIFHAAKESGQYAYPVEEMEPLYAVLLDKDRHYEIIMALFPDRIHTIMPGFLALRAIAKRTGAKRVLLSPYGVREGYLIEKVGLRGTHE